MRTNAKYSVEKILNIVQENNLYCAENIKYRAESISNIVQKNIKYSAEK